MLDTRLHQPWMRPGHPQYEMKLRLSRLGFKLTNTYGDGVINMSRDSDGVMIFIGSNGVPSPPRTHETMVASTQLHIAGIRPIDRATVNTLRQQALTVN